MSALEFLSITKEYRASPFSRRGRVRALDDFTLTVEPGEIVGFLGPNGAGKSTAIHLAMGFMRPSTGTGRMLGKPFGDAATRRRVGFLAENVAFYHRPIFPLIEFYGALNGMRRPEVRRRTEKVIDLLNLQDVATRNAGKLSRGMLQRVGLAQALVNDPELLILDEPTSALDPLGRVRVRELLVSMKSEGKTIFLSSHLLSEIELICDRIAILTRGRLVRVGRTSELLESNEELEIEVRDIPPSALPGAVQKNGFVSLRVPRTAQREVMERIWSAGGEVVRVNPTRRSLEDIFLELTKEEHN